MTKVPHQEIGPEKEKKPGIDSMATKNALLQLQNATIQNLPTKKYQNDEELNARVPSKKEQEERRFVEHNTRADLQKLAMSISIA